MAKGKYRGYARKGISRAGGFKSMLGPIAGGALDSILDPMLPIDGVGGTIAGMFLHSGTTRDIGLYKVGMSIGQLLPIPGRTSIQGGML